MFAIFKEWWYYRNRKCNDCGIQLTKENMEPLGYRCFHNSCKQCFITYINRRKRILKKIEEEGKIIACPLCELVGGVHHCEMINGKIQSVRPKEYLLFDEFMEWKEQNERKIAKYDEISDRYGFK